MNWTVTASRLGILIFLGLSVLACDNDRRSVGLFSVDQRAQISGFQADLPAQILQIWENDALPETQPLSEKIPKACDDNVLCEVAAQWFQSHDEQRVLVSENFAIGPNASALVEHLSRIHAHALPRQLFAVDEIEALLHELATIPARDHWEAQLVLNEELLDAAGAHFRAIHRRHSVEVGELVEWLADADDPALRQLRSDLLEDRASRVAQADSLEWLLTLAWLRYADIQRASNVEYWDEATLLEAGIVVVHPDAPVSEDEEEVVTMPKTIEAWRVGTDPDLVEAAKNGLRQRSLTNYVNELESDNFEEVLAALEPPFEQYAALKQSFADYLELASKGGWLTDLEFERPLRVGQSHAEIPRLRERLRAEGFEVEESESLVFDAGLSSALKHYQFTHQLEESGRLQESVVRSLNRSVETRIAELAVAMQDWRQVPMAREFDGYRIQVNIPDFHAEVWDGDELLSRFRVVVGRYSRDGSEVETKTPLFSDRLSTIVLNPFWNVPQSIATHDLLPKAEEDPEFFELNNYEVRQIGHRTFIRQRPGPGNALGAVKFLFPNEFAVYMHDTPTKHLFGRHIRAFSYGCIRVQNPMNFAEMLIQRDKGWSLRETKRYIERAYARTDDEIYIQLASPVPVHLYYVAVNVVDGVPHFLADIYRTLGERVAENESYVEEWLQAVEAVLP